MHTALQGTCVFTFGIWEQKKEMYILAAVATKMSRSLYKCKKKNNHGYNVYCEENF